MKKLLVKAAQKQLGSFPAKPHFEPNYKPWDQRFCVAPDGDLFKAIRNGKANIITDNIDSFTEKGLKLKSGKNLEADIIISATGLKLLAFGLRSRQPSLATDLVPMTKVKKSKSQK